MRLAASWETSKLGAFPMKRRISASRNPEGRSVVLVCTLDRPDRVLRKERRGDREVAITVPDLGEVADRVPVLVDDIISSGRTMIETVRLPREQGLPPAVCLAVHAVFSEETFGMLNEIAATVVTTNSVPHPSNGIDLAPIIARRVSDLP